MKTSKILIVSAQEDFTFPLAEAARKQIFSEACHLRDSDHEVHIMIVSSGEPYRTVVDGINIDLVKKISLPKMKSYFRSFDSVHFWGTVGLVALMVALLSLGKRKTFTATDGGVFSTGKRAPLRKLLAGYFHIFYDEFRVYTAYQKNVFMARSKKYAGKLSVKQPWLDEMPELNCERSRQPSLLYMGHLSRFKGADIVLAVFENLSKEIPELQLVIADNGLVYDDGCREEVNRLIAMRPGRIALKGKVDPYEEIARAHLLIHPVRQHSGTFAFPLSLYECLLCHTPFLSTRLEGLQEFFDDRFLCESGSVKDFTDRARKILESPDKMAEYIKSNLEAIQNVTNEQKAGDLV